MRRPWRNGGSSHPCSLPRIWGRLHGSLLFCLRIRRRAVSHCVPGLGRGDGERETGNGETAHFMCTVSRSTCKLVQFASLGRFFDSFRASWGTVLDLYFMFRLGTREICDISRIQITNYNEQGKYFTFLARFFTLGTDVAYCMARK
ncbi:hypothetical protein [Desulfosporosinus fructosivorans]